MGDQRGAQGKYPQLRGAQAEPEHRDRIPQEAGSPEPAEDRRGHRHRGSGADRDGLHRGQHPDEGDRGNRRAGSGRGGRLGVTAMRRVGLFALARAADHLPRLKALQRDAQARRYDHADRLRNGERVQLREFGGQRMVRYAGIRGARAVRRSRSDRRAHGYLLLRRDAVPSGHGA